MSEPHTRLPGDVRELNPARVQLLWVNDWYDTPSEAVVEHDGARCLLRLESEDALHEKRPLRWIVYRLSPSDRAELERVHELFAAHVGTHWCFHSEKHAAAGSPDPEAFYAAHRGRAPVALESLTPIGWLPALPQR